MGGQKTIGVIHNEAFQFLKKNYKTIWLVSLALFVVQMVLGFVMSAFVVPFQILTGFAAPFTAALGGEGSAAGAFGVMGAMLGLVCVMAAMISVVSIAVSILQYASYIPGYDATLQSLAGGKPGFDGVWKKFRKNWKRFIGVTAWAMLWECIWSLLFLVPGIVKTYSYRLAPFLVLQYPDMTVRQALRKSIEMMNGYKGRMFGLDLLLIVWGIVSAIAVCALFVGSLAVQVLWVTPMMLLYYSIAYLDIRQAAIDKGLLQPPCTESSEGDAPAVG